MATNFDDADKALADRFEQAVKAANIEGVPGFTEPVMEADQYEPAVEGVAPTMPRDFNRDTGAALAYVLRTQPFRLPNVAKAFLPDAAQYTGCLIYVPDGAAGSPVVAFSDGANWKRCDTLATVS